jgi:Cu+-exporting ATPase
VLEQFFLVGIFGAFGASVHSTITGVGNIYYEVVAVLLAIYTFGKIILARQRRDVLQAAGMLGEEFDRCEIVRPDGSRRMVPAGDVRKGDLIFVQQGGAISVDGMVREGVAFVRQTALTGEAFPAVKRAGDMVLAGSFSLDGALTVEALVPGRNRRLDSVLAAVREGQAGEGPLQRNADRLVAWFLPVVLVASALTFLYWTMRSDWTLGMFNALAVLVVACPCSLGLAMPIGIWSALADMARHGLIAHDGSVVERLASVDAVVFDKTGTLSEEEFQLVDFVAVGDREILRRSVAAIEAASSHPVARAFRQSGILPHAEDVRLLPGIGIEGSIDGARILIGNDAVLDEGNRERAAELATTLKNADGACRFIYVLVDGGMAGVAMLREQLRDSAREALAALSEMRVRCLVLTGDSAAGAAAHRLDAETESELSPEEKVRRVRKLKAGGNRVLFVGDGINDAPAMLNADIGIAVHTGSALARDAAVMELAGGDLRAVAFAIERSKKAMRTMRGNFAFAIGYNVFGILLAAAGIIHPVLAAFLMMVSSFTVTWRALRSVRVPLRNRVDDASWKRVNAQPA